MAAYADRHNTTFLNRLISPSADDQSIQSLPERFKPDDNLIFVEISQGTRFFFTFYSEPFLRIFLKSEAASPLRPEDEEFTENGTKPTVNVWLSVVGLLIALGKFEEHDFFALVVNIIQYAIGTYPQPILGHKMRHNQFTC